MSNIRIAGADTLLRLNQKSIDTGFNRALDLRGIDPTGVNVLTMVLFDHEAHDRTLPMHHRAQVLIKMDGQQEPDTGYLDIEATDWDALPTEAQWKELRSSDSHPVA